MNPVKQENSFDIKSPPTIIVKKEEDLKPTPPTETDDSDSDLPVINLEDITPLPDHQQPPWLRVHTPPPPPILPANFQGFGLHRARLYDHRWHPPTLIWKAVFGKLISINIPQETLIFCQLYPTTPGDKETGFNRYTIFKEYNGDHPDLQVYQLSFDFHTHDKLDITLTYIIINIGIKFRD
jgi:hypothetical protein